MKLMTTRRGFLVGAGTELLLEGCRLTIRPEKGTSDAVRAKARYVADSFLVRHPYEKEKYALWWNWATLWWGVTQLGLADRSLPYVDFMLKFGDHFKWGWFDDGLHGYHADSQCIGQAYLDLALAGVSDKGANVIRELEDGIAFTAPATGDSLDWSEKRLMVWGLISPPQSRWRSGVWNKGSRHANNPIDAGCGLSYSA